MCPIDLSVGPPSLRISLRDRICHREKLIAVFIEK